MTLTKILAHFGSPANFNKGTGLSATSLYYWERIGYIPARAQIKLEKLTDGVLKANIGDAFQAKGDAPGKPKKRIMRRVVFGEGKKR